MARAPRTLMVLPDADRVEHALIEAAQALGFVDARGFTTLGRLVELCEPAKALRRRPCPTLTARLVVSSCAARLDRHPFGEWAKEASFAREVQTSIALFKGQQATPADLTHAAERLHDAGWKARALALARLWEAYEAALNSLALADREDLLAAAARTLETELPAELEAFTEIEVRHVYDWPPLRLAFARALARACDRAGVDFKLTLPLAGSVQLDALVNETMAAFEKGGENDAPFAGTVELEKSETQAWALHRLFGDGGHSKLDVQGLAAFSAATVTDEVGEIARRVRVALDAGASADQVAVAFRTLGSEAELLVEALAGLGVPARTRRGVPLISTALGRLALDLPWLVEGGFPCEDLAHWLESRYVRAAHADADPESVFRAAGVRDDTLGAEDGKGAYQVRLERLAQRKGGEEAKQVRALAKEVQKLLVVCAPLARARTLSEHVAAWSTAVRALGLYDAALQVERLDETSPALARATERALAADQAAAQTIESLATAIEEALALTKSGGLRLSLAAFARWLADAAGEVNLDAQGAHTGAVRILDLRELGGRPLTHLFLGGLLDGRLPSRPLETSLLAEPARAELNRVAGRSLFRLRVGEGDDRLLTREAEDRLVFAQALCSAGSVVLSHPRFDSDGRAALASPWLHALARGTPRVLVDALPLASPPPLDRVHSLRQLRLRAVLEGLSNPNTRLTRVDDAAPLIAPRFGGEPWFQAAQAAARMELERYAFFENDHADCGPFSGAVHGEALWAALGKRLAYGPDHPLSVSSLKVWGNCGFAGFSKHLLGLDGSDEQHEEIDARERGTFLHAVLESLLPRLRDAGLLGKSRAELTDAVLNPLLDAAIAEASASTEKRSARGNATLWPVTREAARRSVLRVIDGENATPFEGAVVKDVELRFGREGVGLGLVKLEAARPDETDVHLVGKIDRVDEGGGKRGVLDYKSTVDSVGKLEKALLVTEFQLPIYLHVLRATGGAAELEAGWQSLKDGEFSSLAKVLEKRSIPLEDLLATDVKRRGELGNDKNLSNALHALLANLRAGNFPARPQDCGHCDFRRVCRISQRRLSPESNGEEG